MGDRIMPSIIRATTTSGLQVAPDNSGSLQLQTNGTTAAVTIDTSQNVGIGTTSPAAKLDVTGNININNGSYGISIPPNSQGGFGLQLRGDTNASSRNWQILSNTTAYGLLDFQVSSTNAVSGFTSKMVIDSSGNVGIGTTSPVSGCKATIFQSANGQCLNLGDGNAIDGGFYGVLQVTRASAPGDNRLHIAMVRNGNIVGGFGYVNNSNTMFVGNSGATNSNGMTLTNAATAWGSQSDERVKNIHGSIENAVEKIGEWRTVYFNYKIDEEGSKQRVGLIAQDVEKTAPEVVDSIGDEQDTLQVRYTEVIPFLVKAIQEQQTIINDLKARIETLEAK
jgi:hypothetical protein